MQRIPYRSRGLGAASSITSEGMASGNYPVTLSCPLHGAGNIPPGMSVSPAQDGMGYSTRSALLRSALRLRYQTTHLCLSPRTKHIP